MIEDGGRYQLGTNLMRVAELEFAFRMAVDLAPRARPYNEAEVLACVATLHHVIELPDCRYQDFEHVGASQLISDGACTDRFVLGPATDANWRGIDLAVHDVLGRLNGD